MFDRSGARAPAVEGERRARGLRLALAGGGTGGHIVPGRHLLAHVGGELADLVWLASGRSVEAYAFEGLEAKLGRTPSERVALRLEPAGGGAPTLASLAVRTAPAFVAARRALEQHASDVLLGLGGFVCFPAVIAARSLGIPVALLEVNAARGRATRALAPFVSAVFHAWPSTLPPGQLKTSDVWTGPPLAPEFESGPPNEDAARRARALEGFDPRRPMLLVAGGSQGAGALNRFVRDELDTLASLGLQVLHQTGPGRVHEAARPRDGYRPVEYLTHVHRALVACDAVLCRGGASTLAEVAALARPAWVVPYPHHADRHQERNARELGSGVAIVHEGELGAPLAAEIARATSPLGAARLAAMARALHGRVRLGAARAIAERLTALAPRRGELEPAPARGGLAR